MVGLDYVINLVDKSFGSGIKKAKQNTKGLDDAVNKTDKDVRKLKDSGKAGFGGIIKWAKRAAIATGLVFSIQQAAAFGNELTNVTAKYEGYNNAIKFASGKEANQNFTFLNKTIKDMNLDMDAAYSGFQTLSGALKGTSLEGQGLRDIFEGVSMAGSVMNLTSEQMKGALLAVSQMASKGKVQAEEIRGQLGERIPGALAIASRAMGVSQQSFNKMLDDGKIYAEDFLPKFAKELKNTFVDGMPAAANSMQAAINRKNNAFISLKRAWGETVEPISKSVLNFKTTFYNAISKLNWKPLLQSLYNLKDAVKPITDRLKAFFSEAGGAEGILDSIKKGVDNFAIGLEIAANGVVFLWDVLKPFIPTLAIAAVTMWAMSAPITAVVVGIGLLAGGLKYAYDKIGWFRGAVDATITLVKGFAETIKNTVVNRIKEFISGITGLGKTLLHFFKGEWSQAWEEGKKATKNLIGIDSAKQAVKDFKNVGKETAIAYADGLKEANKNKKNSSSVFDVFKTKNGADTNIITDNKKVPKLPKEPIVGAAASGSSVKNITFKIESLVKELKIQPQTLQQGAQEVERTVKDMFLRLIRDVELQTQ